MSLASLIKRATWGARYPDGFADRPLPISEWWLHHSVTIAPDLLPPFDDDDAAVRTLENIGQARFGGGISYTFPITPVGRVYQGHSIHRRGAHTMNHNTVAAAICFVGNYEVNEPTLAMIESAAKIMVDEHRAGRARTHRLNGGHRDVYATSCPGKKAYALIATINARADVLWTQSAPVPTPTPVPVPTPPTTFNRIKTKQVQVALETTGDGYWGAGTDVRAENMRSASREHFGYPSKVDTSWNVRLVQAIIDTVVDGIFGTNSKTKLKAWIISFQKILGVTADGYWGPGTERAYQLLRKNNLNKF